ncbi:hypothetical protein ACFJIX_21310 [Roseateles sp. UC29_93]|uniref:hypothetical protein n=1 Tax=Roseateles sp. UC29_93 TaxID=3350177 RepID=UPI003671FAC5
MKHFSTFLTAFCVTLVAAAAIAQTTEPPVTSNASRRQSGTVGPPLEAASMNPPAASASRPAVPTPAPTVTPAAPGPAATPTTAQTPEVEPADTASPATATPGVSAKPAAGSRASRRASGRVTEADGSSGGLPVRPDRN